MAGLKNPWIGYIERSYEQAKKAIFDKMPYRIPEITDHTENDIFVKMISIWCGILEQLNYYIDSRAREIFLSTLRRFSSAVKQAKSADYRVKGTNSASVDLTFYINAPTTDDIIIPIGTEVKTKEGIQYFTTEIGTITIGNLQVIIPASQQILKSNIDLGTTTNQKSQVFEMEEDVVDSSIQITINGENYTPVESLSFTESTDKVFFASINEDAKMTIEFGDDVNGMIPENPYSVVATYYTSSGALGNVGPGNITELVSSITVPSGIILLVNNVYDASGGVSIESTEDLQRRIPKSTRTNLRAVTDQDYIDTAELVNGVAKAGVQYECKNPMYVYIVPNGGGEASSTLKKRVENYFEDKRINTVKVVARSAGDVRILFEIDVAILRNANRLQTVSLVVENITSFLSAENQKIKGTVNIGDIYEVVENTIGVDYSEIKKMTTQSSAIAVDDAPQLVWNRETLTGSTTTVNWKIIIISSTEFHLYKENQFLGIFDIGVEVVQTEIKFTVIDDSYSVDDTWTFITYKYFGSVSILDMSIPTSDSSNIVINSSGGI